MSWLTYHLIAGCFLFFSSVVKGSGFLNLRCFLALRSQRLSSEKREGPGLVRSSGKKYIQKIGLLPSDQFITLFKHDAYDSRTAFQP